jgi:hypothetical protein
VYQYSFEIDIFGLMVTSGHQQMEQDRAPFVFFHQPELARQTLG